MSEIKKYFTSRFKDEGYIVEADLSQIEIVVLAFLSGDENMIADLRNKVDFHCRRAAQKLGLDYKYVWDKCHIDKDESFIYERKLAKSFSFQRSYGAGAVAISESLGITVDEAKDYIKAEEEMYPGVKEMQDSWIEEVDRSATATKNTVKFTDLGRISRTGKLNSITRRQYTFHEEDAPDWMIKRGKLTSFRPTQIKNYPVQGFAGEILRMILGKLFRELKRDEDLKDRALLVNTIHDSVLLDVHQDVLDRTVRLTKNVMESTPVLLERNFGVKFDLPISCDIEFGRNWMTMKEYEL